MLRSALMGLCCLAAMLGGCNKGQRIAVIPKGTSHDFWKSVEKGARQAAAELNVNIVWKGPVKEDDRAEQMKLVEQFTAQGVTGIVLAPVDKSALAPYVQSAMGKKIPVVIFDSGLDGEPGKDFVSFVATDNRQGGAMAGKELLRAMGDKRKVVLFRYSQGHASTTEREEGFLGVINDASAKAADNAKYELLVKDRYAGATEDLAKTNALIIKHHLANADGIFCPNESSTLGMLGALEDLNMLGANRKVRFVGFDATPRLVEALKAGKIDALVAQNPVKMGYEGVNTIVRHMRGEKVPPVIDTGVKLITRDNLSDPEVKKLIGG